MNLKNYTVYCVALFMLVVLSPLNAQDNKKRDAEDHVYIMGDTGGKYTLEDLQGLVVNATGKELVFQSAELGTVAGRKGMEIQFSNNFKIKGPDQLFELFEIVLKKSGYVTKEILGGKYLIEKQDPKVKYQPHPFIDVMDVAKLSGKHSGLVTTLEEIKNTSPNDVMMALKQLLDARIESVVALRGTNTLIITAFPENVVRFHKIIALMDQKAPMAKVKAYPVLYAEAKEVASTIKTVLERLIRSNVKTLPGTQKQIEPMIDADTRTQKIIVVGLEEHFSKVEELLKELDVKIPPQDSNIRIYQIHNRKAEDVVTTIDNIYSKKKDVLAEANEDQPTTTVARPNRPGVNPSRPSSTTPGSADEEERSDLIPQLTFDLDTNTVIAVSASPGAYAELEDIISKLDVRQPQVFIEVAIIEVGKDSERQLGFELLNLANASPGSVRGFGVTSFGNSTINTDNPTGGRAPLVTNQSLSSGLVAGIFKGANDRIPILLRTIQTNSDSLLMDVPSILVTNNQEEAKFTSKQDVPTSTTNQTDTSTNTSFDYREAITELTIKNLLITREQTLDSNGLPVIDANGDELAQLLVQMEIIQESERFTTPTTNPSSPPAKSTRKTETKVNIEDGATVVIGGVSSYRDQNAVDKVPYLADIVKSVPLLGTHLLGPIIDIFLEKSVVSHSRSTMYMFVTPHIIYNPKDLDKISEKVMTDDQLKDLREKWGLKSKNEMETDEKIKVEKDKRKIADIIELEKFLKANKETENTQWMKEAKQLRAKGNELGMSEKEISLWETNTYSAREHMFYLLNYLERYKIERGDYPTAEEGLKALTLKGEKEDEKPVMSFIVNDPWKNAYVYNLIDGRPTISCLGADNQSGGEAENQDLYARWGE